MNIRRLNTYFEGGLAVEAARLIGLTAPHGRGPTRIEPETIPYVSSLKDLAASPSSDCGAWNEWMCA